MASLSKWYSLVMDNLGFWLLVIGIIVAGTLIGRDKPKKSTKQYSYTRRRSLMTKTECEFYEKLKEAIDGKYYLFPQIHLSALLDHRVKGQNWQGAFSKINQKSVDYVLCSKEHMSPVLAIELDDYFHESATRQHRDAEVDQMLQDSGLPLLRFPNSGGSIKKISNQIEQTISKS